jgi:hypothetical protein
MSETALARPVTPFAHSLKWGLASLAVAIGSAVYGAYGDPNPKVDQENAVPFICAVIAVVAIGLYGALLPAGLRGIGARTARWSGWALALGIVALVATPVSFWSGLPVLLGTAGAVLGSAGRQAAPTKRGRPTAAVVVGTVATVASLALLILGNTITPA